VSPPFLRLRRVVRRFATPRGWSVAVGGVDLEVQRGALVSIVGPSGCGKSTLLRMMAGLTPPSEGSVEVDGREVHGPAPGAVYVFQQYDKSIFPWLSVLDNVTFGLRHGPVHVDRAEAVHRGREMLERVGLGGFEAHYPRQLSGGMQQRVAIARALCCRPRLLLMDEPFSAVDALTRTGLQELLLSVWAEFGLTVVLVTHDVEEAVFLSQRVFVLSPPPAAVAAVLEVDLGFPRDAIRTRERPEYLECRRVLLEHLLARRRGERP
jgi:NitT/TauT family transport system ATP-binding protein